MATHEVRLVAGRGWPIDIALAVVSALGATAICIRPQFGIVAAFGAVVFLAVILSVAARITSVLAGGLFILQSSSQVNLAKVGYLVMVTVAALASVANLRSVSEADWFAPFRRLLLATPLILVPILLSLPIAHALGTSLTAWLRDAAGYILLALVMPIAVDAGGRCSERLLTALFVGSGAVAAVGFATDWLSRRGVSSLTLGKFSLSTVALIAAPFCYGIVRVAQGPRRFRWLIFVTLLLSAILVTGSRSGLVLLGGFIGVLGRKSTGRLSVSRMARVLLPLAALAAIAVPTVSAFVVNDPDFLHERIAAAETIFTPYAQSDQSLEARSVEYRTARSVVDAHPLLGAGFGYPFPNLAEGGGSSTTTTLDTPLATPAKIGVIGTILLLAFLVAYLSSMRQARRANGPAPALTAAAGFAVIFLVEIPFGSYFEDKGFPLALMALLALAVVQTRVLAEQHVKGALDSTDGAVGVQIKPSD